MDAVNLGRKTDAKKKLVFLPKKERKSTNFWGGGRKDTGKEERGLEAHGSLRKDQTPCLSPYPANHI